MLNQNSPTQQNKDANVLQFTPFDKMDQRNLSMLFDFYEATMLNGYIKNKKHDEIVVFDLFFRKIPDKGGYVIFSGLHEVITYIKNLYFSQDDLNFLKTKNIFSEEFLSYLKSFKFTCDVISIKEGTIIFPYEPIISVIGPIGQAQLIETMLLICINHQSLIATKSSRISRVAGWRPVMEFGSRRAQGCDGAIYGSRAAYIGGCSSTSCCISEELFGIPAVGTMAHSWVQVFDSEYEAFKAYAETFPDNCVLLVDTFHVVDSGMKNAIRVFDEVLKPKGKVPKGIRIDSGDLVELTKQCRKILDDHGYTSTKIIVSNSLDEHVIQDILSRGACIDMFGVGERLITAKSDPVFGGVYKLMAIKKGEKFVSKIKISETVEKITIPGFKKIVRAFDKKTGVAICDILCLKDEKLDELEQLEINGEKINDYELKDIMVDVFMKGECVYPEESLLEVKERVKEGISKLDKGLLSITKVEKSYPVILSKKLDNLKKKLIEEASKNSI